MKDIREDAVGSHSLEVEFAKKIEKCYSQEFPCASIRIKISHFLGNSEISAAYSFFLSFKFVLLSSHLLLRRTDGPISRRLESHTATAAAAVVLTLTQGA